MARTVFLKTIERNDETLLNIIYITLFGNKSLEYHNQDTYYEVGDLVIYKDPVTNKAEIYRALINSHGPFLHHDWEYVIPYVEFQSGTSDESKRNLFTIDDLGNLVDKVVDMGDLSLKNLYRNDLNCDEDYTLIQGIEFPGKLIL